MPKTMTITADTASERAYLPKTKPMRNKLLLADARVYRTSTISVSYLSMAVHFIVRGKSESRIIEARNESRSAITKPQPV